MPDATSISGADHAHLVLITLGTPRLDAVAPAGGRVTALGPGKPLALLTYLAFAPRRVASRERLCDLLWSDRDPDEARKQLRQTLYLLKQQVGASVMESRPDGIALAADLDVDAHAFAAEVAADNLEHAEQLYTGEFFDGFASPGADAFEHWCESERARIRSVYVHTAESLARRALDRGRFADAARVARRLRVAEPFGETGWRLLLEALTSAGDSLGALSEADAFEQWLRSEEIEPEPASAMALRSARQVARPTHSERHEPDLVAELVGREREFAAIQQLWNEAKVKGARRVHVDGESGLGKTRLLLDLSTRLRAQRARVVYRRASPGEQYIPFAFSAGLAAALAELPGARGISPGASRALLGLNPSLSSTLSGAPDSATGDEALRIRALALLELITALTDEAPVALLVDDLHWCDQASQRLLAFLAAEVTGQHVLVVTAARSRQALPPLPDDTVRISLEPLNNAQVEALVVSLGALPAEPWARQLPPLLAESARGNPLFVMEALRLCLEKGVLSRSTEGWACFSPHLLDPTLQHGLVIGRRLRELGAPDRQVLLLVALAAGPIPVDMVAEAARMTRGEVEAMAARLDAHGVLRIEGDSLTPAHDEIADAAAADADAPLAKQAHAALGAAMAARADPQWRRRAVAHLVEADEWASLPEITARVLKGARVAPSGLDAEITSLLGAGASVERATRLRRALPFSIRHPRVLRTGIGVVALLAVAGAATVALGGRRTRPAPDAVLIAGQLSGNPGANVRRIEIRLADWDAALPLVPSDARSTRRWARYPFIGNRSVQQPGARAWAEQVVSPDTGGVDIELVDARGRRDRLTWTPADDKEPFFSPDGTLLAFGTSRWSSQGHTSLAILDLRTRVVRRLTQGAGLDGPGLWSRDGSRVAFIRRNPNSGSETLCWITVDGTREDCPDTGAWRPGVLVGWVDDSIVLVNADSGAGMVTLLLDVTTGRVSRTDIPSVSELSLDASGRWVLAGVAVGNRIAEWRAGSITRFDRSRRVALPDSAESFVSWWQDAAPSDYLDRLLIARPQGSLPVGVPILLGLRGWTKAGTAAVPQAVRWHSLNETVARIDSVGQLVARDTGMAVIEASAGGWRSTRDTIRIGPATTPVVLDERWTADWQARWHVFGDPAPEVVNDAKVGHAFLNKGDGSFFSGAYLIRTLHAARGLAVDLELSTPITRTQWQVATVGVASLTETARLARWDHRTGYFPADVSASEVSCNFAYPKGEGAGAAQQASPFGAIESLGNGAPRRLDTTSWYRLRLQILPDGRCGIALNGHAVYIGARSRAPRPPVYLMLYGSTVATRILVGRVLVTEGVPSDVDWSGLEQIGDVWRARRPQH